jgi:hypothetical protein
MNRNRSRYYLRQSVFICGSGIFRGLRLCRDFLLFIRVYSCPFAVNSLPESSICIP